MKLKYFENSFLDKKENVLILNAEDGHVENFGKQWRDHSDVQIDSLNDFELSKKMLEELLFQDLDFLNNKTVLEIGCGAGRFTEYLVKHAKECVSLDLSSAIFYNIAKEENNLVRIKADFLDLKPREKFDVVLCRGVLQHTPHPKLSIEKLFEFVKDSGLVFFDIYPKPKAGLLHPKYLIWRPLFKKLIPYEKCEILLSSNIRTILRYKRFIKKMLFNSKFISDCLIPVWDYHDVLDLTEEQLEKWAVLDTLDGLYAHYDIPMSNREVLKLLEKLNFEVLSSKKEKNIFKVCLSR